MASKYFRKALAEVKPENRRYVQKNLDIVEQIVAILDAKGMSQRELAKRLHKTEAEVSRMLSGLHNLTLKTLTRLETALEEDIIITPQKAREQVKGIKYAKVISVKSQNLTKRAVGVAYHAYAIDRVNNMAKYGHSPTKRTTRNQLENIRRGEPKVLHS